MSSRILWDSSQCSVVDTVLWEWSTPPYSPPAATQASQHDSALWFQQIWWLLVYVGAHSWVHMYLEVLGQTLDARLVETPLTSPSSNPTPFHTSTLAPCRFSLYVCVCTGLRSTNGWSQKRKKRVDSWLMWIFFHKAIYKQSKILFKILFFLPKWHQKTEATEA